MELALQIEKTGKGPALVLLHGWGVNSAVWTQVIDELANDFTVYCIDLPGFGINHEVVADASINAWADVIAQTISEPAIWLGWSLGGLIVTQIALDYPDKVLGTITVASSPKFTEAIDWFGIKPDVMLMFMDQLSQDFSLTLERFLAIQAMGSEHARKDINALKKVLKERPLPKVSSLHDGLCLLNDVDLRDSLHKIKTPFLRMYGKLDSLVPKKIIPLVDDLSKNSQIYIFDKASHAPFISHPQEFIEAVKGFGSIKN